jgi:hypothetical protein
MTNQVPDCSEVSVGQTYTLRHCRFGKAVVRVTAIPSETWIDIEVVSGILCGINDAWGSGDTKTVRREHCRFMPVQSPK